MVISAHRPATRPASLDNPVQNLQALLHPLQQLDARLRQIIEVRQVFAGTAFEGLRIGTTAPFRSLTQSIEESSPLARVRQAFSLSEFELDVMVLAIAPDLDRRYERLYAELQHRRRPTIPLCLDLLCNSHAQRVQGRQQLEATAALLSNGLVQLRSTGEPLTDESTAASAEVSPCISLAPIVSQFLMGQAMNARLMPYCELSRPSQVGYITNSPLLPELLSRLKQGLMPPQMVLSFTGIGSKALGAQAIAEATNKPLLTVDLSEVFATQSESQAELSFKAEQILIQAQLWDAVIFLASPPAYAADHSHWLTAPFVQAASPVKRGNSLPPQHTAFYQKISEYKGIVIFTGQPPSLPHSNNNKGIISIPFTQPAADTPFSYWQTCLQAAQIALGETERCWV